MKRFDTRNALEPQGAQLHQLSALVLEGRKEEKVENLNGGRGERLVLQHFKTPATKWNILSKM